MSSQSHTGGVAPMSIAGRLVNERERLRGMTDSERQWRAQYLKDMILTNEPRYVVEYEKGRFNPIRRFYRFPLDTLGKALVPLMGKEKAECVRYFTGKFFILTAVIYATHYYMKYNRNDWTRTGGWLMRVNKGAVLPGDRGFPMAPEKTKPQDYADRGFKNSPI